MTIIPGGFSLLNFSVRGGRGERRVNSILCMVCLLLGMMGMNCLQGTRSDWSGGKLQILGQKEQDKRFQTILKLPKPLITTKWF